MSTQPKTHPLAIAALVVGIIGLCLQILAPIALILGIIGLVKIGDGQGEYGGKGLAIAGTVIGGLGTLMIPILMAIAIPNFIRYQNRAKQAEAQMNVRQIKMQADLFKAENRTYPKGDSGWTPAEPCPKTRCQPDPALWSASPWKELDFSMRSGHYYQYRYKSDGTNYTIEAKADLDNDGNPGIVRIENGGRIERDRNEF